jgi:RimJ/RimL family protein N-acetyltransferase
MAFHGFYGGTLATTRIWTFCSRGKIVRTFHRENRLSQSGWPGFEIGWTLSKEFWGKGYATEGARGALEYAFDELDQEHVISLIHPDNHASIRVAERLGEKPEGETEIQGLPVIIYGIDRSAYDRTQ